MSQTTDESVETSPRSPLTPLTPLNEPLTPVKLNKNLVKGLQLQVDDADESIDDIIERIEIEPAKLIAKKIYSDLVSNGVCFLGDILQNDQNDQIVTENIKEVENSPGTGLPIVNQCVEYMKTIIDLVSLKLITKTFILNKTCGSYNIAFFTVLYEIVSQQYAYEIIENDSRLYWVKIPKIYEVRYNREESTEIGEIVIVMEYLPKVIDTTLWYDEIWMERVHLLFDFFEKNGLFHLDSAHRNLYFTENVKSNDFKLALIDFGQSQITHYKDMSNYYSSQPTGYPMRLFFKDKTQEEKEDIIMNWLKGIPIIKRTSEIFNDNSKIVNARTYGVKYSKRKSKDKSKRKSKRKTKRNRK